MSTSSDDDDEFSEDNVLSTLFPSRLKTISPQKPILAPSQSPAGAALPVAPVADGAPLPVAHARAARLSDHAGIQTAQSLWMDAQDGTSEPQRRWQAHQHHQPQSQSHHQNGSIKRTRPGEDAANSSKRRVTDWPMTTKFEVPSPQASGSSTAPQATHPNLGVGSSTGRPARRSMPSGRLEALTLAVPVIDITDSSDGGESTPSTARPRSISSAGGASQRALGVVGGLSQTPASATPPVVPPTRSTPPVVNPTATAPPIVTPVPVPPPYGGLLLNRPPPKPPAPTPSSVPAKVAPIALSTSKSKRAYLVWSTPDGGMRPTCGALIPDGYRVDDGSEKPYPCPIDSCGKRFSDLRGVGGHFQGAHKKLLLNDNCDTPGTLTIVGYNPEGGLPIIVSQNPRQPNRASPRGQQGQVAGGDPPHASKSSAARTPATDQLTNIPPPLPTPRTVVAPPMVTTAVQMANMLPSIEASLQALQSAGLKMGFLESHILWPKLKALPCRRSAPSKLKLGDGPPMLGLILYLAGVEAPRSCKPCMEPSKKTLCIVGDDTLPPDVAAVYGGSCAMCYYRHKKWHQQNKCTLESFTRAEALKGPPTRNGGNATADKGLDSSEYENDEDSAQDNSKAAPRSSLMVTLRPGPLALASLTAAFQTQSAAARGEESDRRSPATGGNGNSRMSGPTRTNGGGEELRVIGNSVAPDMLVSQDWEFAPGYRQSTGPHRENIAFSNSYLISNRSVRVADGLGFNITYLLPGAKLKLGEDHNNLRICSVATGVAKVKLGDEPEFIIGTSGMFKILPGALCRLENRLYITTILHVTSVSTC